MTESMEKARPFTRSAQMRLTEGDFGALWRLARQGGLTIAALVRRWVKERLIQELAPGRDSGPWR